MTRAPTDIRYEGSLEACADAAEVARKHREQFPDRPAGYFSSVVYHSPKTKHSFEAYYLKNRAVVVRELRPE